MRKPLLTSNALLLHNSSGLRRAALATAPPLAPTSRALRFWGRADDLGIDGTDVVYWNNHAGLTGRLFACAELGIAGHNYGQKIVGPPPAVDMGVGGIQTGYEPDENFWFGATASEIWVVLNHRVMPQIDSGYGGLHVIGPGGTTHLPFSPPGADVYDSYMTTARKNAIYTMTGDARVAAGVPFAYHAHSRTGEFTHWLNTEQKFTTAANVYAPAASRRIFATASAGYHWQGYAYEILIYTDTLTAEERAATDAYLQDRYGYT